MNEILRRALLEAQLSEEDVAARLAVDPKTVRRWTEGRVPYLRHRWELARLLGRDEADLWPQVSVSLRPTEVRAIYPHRDAIPAGLWTDLFASAEHQIGILSTSALFLADQPGVMAVLDDRTKADVIVRICLAAPEFSERTKDIDTALLRFGELRRHGGVEIRKHRAALSHSMFFADDELMIVQHIYGVHHGRAPVLNLRRFDRSELIDTYLESFNRIWENSSQHERE